MREGGAARGTGREELHELVPSGERGRVGRARNGGPGGAGVEGREGGV
jgi:hypothetical protein